MHKTVVIDIVGLSSNLIGDFTPFIKKYLEGKKLQTITPMLPAVTTSVQSTYVTGKWPVQHGIVGNGWYDREQCSYFLKFMHIFQAIRRTYAVTPYQVHVLLRLYQSLVIA